MSTSPEQLMIDAVQSALMRAGHLRLMLHDHVAELAKLHADLERCTAVLRRPREKGGQ